MNKISASILTADFGNLEKEIRRAEAAGVDMIHVDIMDGCFVPNISIGLPIVKALKKITNLPLDVHLMIVNPEKYIENFAAAGADMITVHSEATNHLNRVINQIKENGCKAGVAFNPASCVEQVKWILPEVDLILQMTVNPGFGGQKLIPSIVEKIKYIRGIIDASNRQIDLQVDGGINASTIADICKAGANNFVAGAALFNSDDMDKAIKEIRGQIQ